MNKQNTIRKKIIFIISLFIIGLWITYALNTYQTWYKIYEANDNSGKNWEIIKDLPDSYEWKNKCVKITNYMDNSSTSWFFSPTKSLTEWNNFKSWCDTNTQNDVTDNNPNCKIQVKTPEEAFHVIDTGGWHKDAPHTDNHTCWIDQNWKLECWWSNKCDQSSSTCNQAIVPSWLDSWVKAVYLWFEFSMAIDKDWKIKCWWRDYGWAWACSNIPSVFTNSTANTKNLSVWPYWACALDNANNNKIYCWWGWENQQCIRENTPSWYDKNIKFMDVWDYTVCVIKNNWNLKCWGEDEPDGSGGSVCNKNTSEDHNYWQYAINNDSDFNNWMKKVAVWKYFTCWLKEDWRVKCFINKKVEWEPVSSFTNIPSWFSTGVVDIQAWPRTICALNTSWQIWCWWVGIDNPNGGIYWVLNYKIYRINWSNYEPDPNEDNSTTAQDHRKNNNIAFWMWFYTICAIKTDYSTECWWLHSPKNWWTDDNFIPSSFTPKKTVSDVCDESVFQ